MMPRPVTILILLLILTPFCLLLAVSTGSSGIQLASALGVLTGNLAGLEREVIMALRLPRAISAFATGGLLAMSGVLMQVLLRNPLADPYILGISGGAAVTTLLAMLIGISGILLSSAAFAGALLSMLLVFTLAHGRGSWTTTRLLLCGVVIAAGWGAVISFILAISSQSQIHSMLFWLMGDLSYTEFPTFGLVVLLVCLVLSIPMMRNLNLLAHGDAMAASLGVAVPKLRWQIYILASLLAATAVTLAGSIGFIGLVIPHLIRLVGIRDHRLLIPASILLGGSLLMVADTLARTVIAPQQLPVGVLTALIGVPIFLLLMQKSMSRA